MDRTSPRVSCPTHWFPSGLLEPMCLCAQETQQQNVLIDGSCVKVASGAASRSLLATPELLTVRRIKKSKSCACPQTLSIQAVQSGLQPPRKGGDFGEFAVDQTPSAMKSPPVICLLRRTRENFLSKRCGNLPQRREEDILPAARGRYLLECQTRSGPPTRDP